jgi:MFS transporter, DHA2 family, lincomycin resistance protein
MSATTSAPHTTVDRLTVHDRTLIGLLLVATFVVILNETIMSVALPVLITDLHITASTAQWLSTGFMLTMAVVIPVTGFLIQRFKTRTLFIAAMSLFSLGTLGAGLATGFPMLLAARVVQGSGTAIMIPLLMTTVITLVPESRRGQIMGNVSIVISVAPAIGPTISGIILSVLTWRWMFLIVLPIAIVALIIGARLVKNIGEPRRVRIDVFSVVLSALGFGFLVYALNEVGAGGSGFTITVSAAVGGLSLIAFVIRQLRLQRTDGALLDLRPFLSRTFTASTITISVAMIGFLGSAILIPIYLQQVLHQTPLTTGLLVLPGGVIMGVFGPVVGRLYDRLGPRRLLVPGAAVLTIGLFMLSFVGETTPIGYVLASHVTLSLGLAFLFTPLFSAGLGSVPSRLTSHGSAIFATVQQVGGAAGTALVIAILSVTASAAVQSGTAPLAAEVIGLRTAFFVAALTSIVPIVASFFVGKPAASAHGGSAAVEAPSERVDAH